MPQDVVLAGGILRIQRIGKIHAIGRLEVLPAVLAVAHTGTGPAIREYSVYHVAGYDLLRDSSHVVEVIGTKRTGDPQIGRGCVAALVTFCIDGDPIGVSIVHVLVYGVWIGSRDY